MKPPVAALFDNHFSIQNSSLLSFEDLRAIVQKPQKTSKDHAFALAPQLSGHKTKAEVLEWNEMSLCWIDIDTGNKSIDDVKQAIDRLSLCSYIIYATASSTEDNKRWRVLIELIAPIPCIEWVNIQEAMQILLQGDTSATRIQQILYAPNRGQYYEYYIQDGQPLSATPDPIQAIISDLKEKRAALHNRVNVAMTARPANGEFNIQSINDSIDLPTILDKFGYTPKGRKYVSPNSSSGVAGFIAFNDGRWFSHHAGDADIGHKVDGGVCGDAFDLVAYYEYGNDKQKAYANLASLLDESNRKRRFEWAKANGGAR